MKEQNKVLLTKINVKRNEMIKIGLSEGLASKKTVKCSQELDELLNLYHGNKKEKFFSNIAV